MTWFRTFEIILYSSLNLLPHLSLALYPFSKKLRFSKPKITLFIFALWILQCGLGIYATSCPQEQKSIVSLLSTLCYGIFYFVAVKDKLGKLVFVLMIISNFGGFIVVCAKCMEGYIFPEMAWQNNRWSFSLCTIIAQSVFVPLLLLYFKKYVKEIANIEVAQKEWRLLWLIPVTFSIFWYYNTYFSEKSSIELALSPVNLIFNFCVNIGALLVYVVIVNAMVEFKNNLDLKEENKQLQINNLSYEKLKSQIDVTRRARHDLRHHMKVVSYMAENNQSVEIKAYIDQYLDQTELNNTFMYCGNVSLNALLLFYEQKAKDNNINFKAYIRLPQKINIEDVDMTVVFGNMLENAIDGCKTVKNGEKIIYLKIYKPKEEAIVFKLENSFDGNIKLDNDRLVSTKEKGSGIGTESIKYVVQKYNGDIQIKVCEGKFIVSGVILQPLDATR